MIYLLIAVYFVAGGYLTYDFFNSYDFWPRCWADLFWLVILTLLIFIFSPLAFAVLAVISLPDRWGR